MAARIADGTIFRFGRLAVRDFTPRPKDAEPHGDEPIGLSFQRRSQAGRKGNLVDVTQIPPALGAFEDPKNPNHVLVAPVDDRGTIDGAKLKEWASFRELTDEVHPLTELLMKAVVEESE